MTGKTIARYEIQSEIGRGGMAAVYLAYDPNFRRNVAIKLVSVSLQENPVFRERFEREAHLIAKIEHPAIVPVYDFGEQDNQLYLVMRYMPGGSLANKIKEGRLTLEHATQIISQIAPALDAVHAQGIVHRDLKPANILLDNFGNAAISDFGIAHFTAATTDLTGSAIIGTPSYMSPEQVRGDDSLDGRSDIYALGVILFEMLTSRGPFHAPTPMSVALKHITEPVPSIRSIRPDLPMELEHIISKAMAKDRERRYASAAELVHELRAIPDLSQGSGSPAPASGRLTRREELLTEVDVDEGSQPVSLPSDSPPIKVDPTVSPERDDRRSVPGSHPRGPSRGMLQIAAVAVVGLVILFTCGSAGLFGTWASLGLPGLFPGPEPSQTAAPTLMPITPTAEIVLFRDDFSDPDSGWPTLRNEQGGYAYRADGYHIFVDEREAVFWAKTNREDGNASISVDAKPAAEGRNSYFGLLCRFRDDRNFYYFVVRANGDYTIGKYKNAQFQSLFSEGWRQNEAVKEGNQTNRLKADCVGNTLRFYANNVLLDEANDTDFDSGPSGILVGALDPQGFEVIFNNFLITKPGD
jgi:serine/threonine-protein kinase